MSQDLLHFGLSVPMIGGGLPDYPELPERFELLELPGDALLLPEETLTAWLGRQNFTEIGFRNLVPADLLRQVCCESGVIVQEMKQQLRTLCAKAHRFGAVSAGLDPDWEALFLETGRRDTFAGLLRAAAGDLEQYNLVLQMAIRMPGSGAVAPERALELVDQLPAHRLKVALDVHPHELLNRPPDWEAVLAPFRFDVGVVRLSYDSASGNQLLFRHVQTLLAALRNWRCEVNVLLAPGGSADLNALERLIQEANGQ